MRGRRVEVHGPQACTGITAGLDEHGFLLVRTAAGIGHGADRRHSRRGNLSRAMLLALDVGNTEYEAGPLQAGLLASMSANNTSSASIGSTDRPELAAHWRLTTHRAQTVDEYGALFINLFQMNGIIPSHVTHIIISSVVPPIDSTLRQVCETLLSHRAAVCRAGHQDRHARAGGQSRPSWAPTGWPTAIAAFRALRRSVHRGQLRHGDQV